MDAKHILKSKTLWMNVIMAGLVFANAQWPMLDLTADKQAAIVAVVNIVLRAITTRPVTV